MSKQTNAIWESILAIPNDKVKEPNQKVHQFLQEAENLYLWSLDDIYKLNTVGIKQEMVEELPLRTAICREAQAYWNKTRHTIGEAQKRWKEIAPEAYTFRSELLASMRYAYRNNPTLLNKVKSIKRGTGHSDMVQDLSDIAVLGQNTSDLLLTINFNLDLLDKAAAMSKEISSAFALSKVETTNFHQTKLKRDKAFMYLKERVDEIRQAGQYVFRNNPERKVGYISTFWKQKNSRKSKTSKR